MDLLKNEGSVRQVEQANIFNWINLTVPVLFLLLWNEVETGLKGGCMMVISLGGSNPTKLLDLCDSVFAQKVFTLKSKLTMNGQFKHIN